MNKKHKILILKLLIDGNYEDFNTETRYLIVEKKQNLTVEILFMKYFSYKMIGDNDQCEFYSKKINQILMDEDLEDFIGWLKYSGPSDIDDEAIDQVDTSDASS